MYVFIILIHVLVCLILIAAILLQSGRGGGLADMFGGATSQTIFGARASTFLTRATTVAASLFLITCFSLTVFSGRRGRSLLEGKALVTEETEAEVATGAVPEKTVEGLTEEVAEPIQEELPQASEAESAEPE